MWCKRQQRKVDWSSRTSCELLEQDERHQLSRRRYNLVAHAAYTFPHPNYYLRASCTNHVLCIETHKGLLAGRQQDNKGRNYNKE